MKKSRSANDTMDDQKYKRQSNKQKTETIQDEEKKKNARTLNIMLKKLL